MPRRKLRDTCPFCDTKFLTEYQIAGECPNCGAGWWMNLVWDAEAQGDPPRHIAVMNAHRGILHDGPKWWGIEWFNNDIGNKE